MLSGRMVALAVFLALPLLGRAGSAADPAAPAPGDGPLEARVQERRLENGLRVLVVEDRELPVVSVVTAADVGSIDERPGITGAAHVFEHMAFKGSREIGVTDPVAEAAALEKLDAAFEKLRAEKDRGAQGDKSRLAALEKEFAALEEAAARFVVKDEYNQIAASSGWEGLNASTGADSTQFYVSFPSNQLERWFLLEADRFKEPVLRDFYREKAVIREERRMRSEQSPIGNLVEKLAAAAFRAHPYGQPVVGTAADIEGLTRAQAAEFFRQSYGANRLTIAIVGDVTADGCFELAERYFGKLPRAAGAGRTAIVEPAQDAERRVEVAAAGQAAVAIGHRRPAASHPDDAVFDAIEAILSTGRAGRLQAHLVGGSEVAAQASAFSGYPGSRDPHLFVLFASPAAGHGADALERALLGELEALRRDKVGEAELARARRMARAGVLRGLGDGQGLAMQLATAQTVRGSWREAFRALGRLDAVTADDIQRVARETFKPANRTVARIVNPEGAKK